MNYQNSSSCLSGCAPAQSVQINIPIDDLSKVKVYNDCLCEYDIDKLEASWSIDLVTWTCWTKLEEAIEATMDLKTDFYVKLKVSGPIGKVEVDGEIVTDITTEIVGCFQWTAEESSSTFNPYANQENAVSLYQQLAESVSQVVGIPCWYIKLSPDPNSKDITFKEYTLMNVDKVKNIKIVIQDNVMPSSKPEFNEWGLDWQTDWEVEITKGQFATAFGPTAQPMEGDLVYIPMMRRMWMVNGGYEEKRDGFMWQAATFKVALVKYQEKDSVQLGDAEGLVKEVVKNTYEDLFGEEDEAQSFDTNEQTTSAPQYAANKLYAVFESDATRKHITCDSLDLRQNSVYYKGTLISDMMYEFLRQDVESKISYQYRYCGSDLSISFLIKPEQLAEMTSYVFEIGHVKVMIEQQLAKQAVLTLNIDKKLTCNVNPGGWNLVVIKWSRSLNTADMSSYRYVFNERVPEYLRSKQHWWFEMNDPISSSQSKWNDEMNIPKKTEVALHNFSGCITNFKLFDVYNDDLSEMLQMYPNHQHLVINDTARRIVDLPGVRPA